MFTFVAAACLYTVRRKEQKDDGKIVKIQSKYIQNMSESTVCFLNLWYTLSMQSTHKHAKQYKRVQTLEHAPSTYYNIVH